MERAEGKKAFLCSFLSSRKESAYPRLPVPSPIPKARPKRPGLESILVPEMAHAGKYHGDAVFVADFDGIGVVACSAGLDYGAYARRRSRRDPAHRDPAR